MLEVTLTWALFSFALLSPPKWVIESRIPLPLANHKTWKSHSLTSSPLP
jgi:hypothetical protein